MSVGGPGLGASRGVAGGPAAGALGLGLGDLLARTHAELVRVTSRRSAVPTRALRGNSVRNTSAHDGLCLAA